MTTKQPPSGRPYWYHTHTYECPLCYAWHTYRTRRYSPKPEDWFERNEVTLYWCGCGAL